VGDDLVIDADTARPIRLRIVGALADSVLQGEIMIAESAFTRLFPEIAGYRVLLADVDATRAGDLDEVAATLEERLAPYGLDAQSSMRKLEAYHRVENTYLSTFQTLGRLGLLLGTVGLATVLLRNALERRRELALLGAVGYRHRHFRLMAIAENALLLGAGLAAGTLSAALAIAPAVVERGGRVPLTSGGALLLFAVFATGLLSSFVATGAAVRGPLLASLRSE
jgi:hypothetical protein